jgi:hypothetical protein
MRIARVFPRRTKATPDDAFAFVGESPIDICAYDYDEVHVSATFSYDQPEAERLAEQWGRTQSKPVKIGGPAFGDPGGDFTPGMYLKHGYVITSRGCPNNCWFCDVHSREGGIRELPITDGWMLQDSNLLACSEDHIRAVFAMLKRQPHRAQLTGGLEAKRLEWWHVELLWDVRPKQIFCAYDSPEDREPLIAAGRMLRLADFTRSHMRCYVLIGGPRDTFAKAQERLIEAWEAGFLPMAMLWKGKLGLEDPEWRNFQRQWTRPAITKRVVRDYYCGKEADDE